MKNRNKRARIARAHLIEGLEHRVLMSAGTSQTFAPILLDLTGLYGARVLKKPLCLKSGILPAPVLLNQIASNCACIPFRSI